MQIPSRWSTVPAVAALAVACSDDAASPPTVPGSVTALTAATVPAQTIAGTAYASSTKLNVSWTAPSTGASATSYVVIWTDQVTSARESTTVTATTASLTGLKSKTSYKIEVRACAGTSCETGALPSATAETPIEAWQLQGTGNTIFGLTKVVSDGNVRLKVLRYGSDAPTGLAGRLQLYYGPFGTSTQQLTVGTAAAAASQSTSSTYLSFTSKTGSAGLISPTSAATLVSQVATGEGVPLASGLGSKVRLFFEASGADGKTRILHVDSQDGYVGQDFNSGAATTCSTTADYGGSGGGCAPTVDIGVEGDATGGNLKISNARQFKIGFPSLTDWRWDGAAGTFMVFTTDFITGCSTSSPNHGYAVWSGTAWAVQYAANGCPKLFSSVQAMHPVHLGGVKYKAYYGDPSDQTGKVSGTLPFLGPKKLVYADGALTGTATRVDYEDWESVSSGRTITFLWPDGSTLNATARGYIDDFSIVAPTGSLTWQMYYLAITDGTVAPLLSAAILVNP